MIPPVTPPMTLAELRAFLADHLMDRIVPFWLPHALDERGGINACIADDGTVLSHDKYMWSQLRAIYTFSSLYRRMGANPAWLDAARQIAEFCRKHGRDEQGRWVLKVDRDGRTLEGATSIYADGFAILGFVELHHATGDEAALVTAIDTWRNVRVRLASPGFPAAPYDIPQGLKCHGVSMIFSQAFHELARATGDPAIAADALDHAEQVMTHFRKPELKALLEYVRLDGSRDDSPPGRAIVPGHAIESMWFQIHQYRDLGRHDRVLEAVECIRWHVERGWDPDFGGLVLGLDLEGKPPYWGHADSKIWWPHTETLYALLLAHEVTGEAWCLDAYWRVHEVTFKHFPLSDQLEWRQRLNRDWTPMEGFVAFPVKDPFHLPRALMLSIDSLDRQLGSTGANP